MPTSRYRFSADARRDMRRIARYSRATWGRDQADRYNASLNAVFDRLAAFPSLGQSRPDVAADVRVLPVGQHVVLYRDEPDGVLILRVLHQRMNLDEVDLD